jgi:DNA polymerase
MWVDKFLSQCLQKAEQYGIKGINVDEALALKAVTGFRDDYDKVKQLWYDADRAARNAILNPGKTFKAGPFLTFCTIKTGGVPFLAMRLPAGRSIVYPFPALEDDPKKPGAKKITFYGKLPMKDDKWGRVSTYGGKLVENATQGTAADVMGHGACNALERGFDVVTLIHDQALGADDGRDVEEFCAALTDTPPWAAGLPVKAEGKLVPYYLKL